MLVADGGKLQIGPVAFDVLRQFLEGLITEFNCAESDTCVALSLCRMQLS